MQMKIADASCTSSLLVFLCVLCVLRGEYFVYSFQPCASRTATIAARMSFHVRGFISVSLGNMQPSQQMWLEALGRLAAFVAEPVAGVLHDVELAVGRVRQAVPARLVVRAGAEHFAVVLGDVEIDRPRAQRVGELLVAGVERGRVVPVESRRAPGGLPARCGPA